MKHFFGQWRLKSRWVPLCLLLMLGAAAAPQAEAGGVDFKQASNKNSAVGNVVWINSILQQNNSRYFEGLSTLQRLVLLDIPLASGDHPNRHALNFSHQAAKSGLHAYDFLTSWEQARAASLYYSGSDLFDPLNPDGDNLTAGSTGEIIRQLRGGPHRLAAAAPNNLGVVENDDVQARANAYAVKFGERVIRLYGDAPIVSAELRFDGYSGSTDKFAEYTLVWESSSTNLLIEMAGHLAIGGAAGNPLGYGPGRGSASINGGPYHFKLATLDGAALCSQDNQIKGADIMVPPPVVALNLSAQNICVGSEPATFTATVTADGTVPFSYAWTGPNGFTSNAPTISVHVAGTYTVVVTDGNGLTSPALSTLLTVTPCPTVTIASAEITCAKPQVDLVAESSATNLSYHWIGPGIVSGGNQQILTVNQPGEYSLVAADPNGCSTTAKVAVAENKILPDASATGGTLTCANPQITVRASAATAGAAFRWTGPGIVAGADTATPMVNMAGTYQVTVTDPLNGCSAIASAVVNENKAVPVVTAAGGVLTCAQKELRLSASSSAAGSKFTWTGPGLVSGADTASPIINKPGEYIVTVQDPVNGCSATTVATVTENLSAPVVKVTGATLTCAKTETSLHAACATAGATFRWSGPGIVSGAETDSPLVNLAGVYSVTVTDPANGCTTTASVTVAEDKQPPVVSATGATLTCAEPTATLRAVSSSATSTFVWTGPGIVSGAATATPSVNQPGTYSVVITDERNGCFSTVTAVVNENKTAPEITVTGGTLTCANPQIIVRAFSATAGALFQWRGPGIVAGGDASPVTVNAAGTYVVTVTDPANGCSATATAVVLENKTVPSVTAEGGVLTCAQQTLNLRASSSASNGSFMWTGAGILAGADSASPTVNAPGAYTVVVTDPVNGCVGSAAVTVTQDTSAPAVTVQGAVLTCSQTQAVITASMTKPGMTCVWSGPGIVSGEHSGNCVVNVEGLYSIAVTDPATGCTTTESVSVTKELPRVLALSYAVSSGQVGVFHNSPLLASGGVPPYRFSITGGALPPGLTLAPNTGALTGTPAEPGSFGFTAQVLDANGSCASSTTVNGQITIIGNGGYRVTGGSNRGTNMFQAIRITTALPTHVSHAGQVGAANSLATPFNPNSECISGEWQHNRHLRGNSLVGKLHASGNGNVHQFDSLLGACLPCPEDLGAVGVVGGVCNPGNRICGPEPRRAPGNKICFSGVGDYTSGDKIIKAVFRVDIEDRGEGNSQPPDRYRIRIWLLDPSYGRNPDPDSAEAMELRYAASADPDQIAVLATTENLKVNIPPDIDDGGNMTQGNHQIHPETGAQCGESAHNPPTLKTTRGSGGTIVATWPAVHSNYVLQTSSSMTSTNWLNVTTAPVVLKNRRMVTNAIGNGIQFFRLNKR